MRKIKSAMLLTAMAATVVLTVGQPLQTQAAQVIDAEAATTEESALTETAVEDAGNAGVTGIGVVSAEDVADTADTLEATDTEAVSASVPTPSQVYQTMIAMKASYPEGMPWTNNDFYAWKGGGQYYGGYGCVAFAFILSDAAFGDLPSRTHTNFDDIRVGDIIRMNYDMHSVVALEVYDTYIVVAEGNFNSSIHWGRQISLDEIRQTGTYVTTRYPEGTPKPAPIDKTKVRAFCKRLYQVCLGRNPETAGLDYWTEALANGEKSGIEAGLGFVFSPEYINKKTSNAEYIEMLYQVFLDRASDAGGREYWSGMLEQGMSRQYVFQKVAQSEEYTKICQNYGINRGTYTLTQARDQKPELTKYVNRLYSKVMNRTGEADGLNYWCGQIQSGQKSVVGAAEEFFRTPEFLNKKTSNTEYVKVLYRTFMGREADKAGLNYWVRRLNAGENRNVILRSFAGCPEFQNIIKSFGL